MNLETSWRPWGCKEFCLASYLRVSNTIFASVIISVALVGDQACNIGGQIVPRLALEIKLSSSRYIYPASTLEMTKVTLKDFIRIIWNEATYVTTD